MNNTGNVITTYNGIEIYDSEIAILCDEYERQFADDLEERKKQPMFFTGLVVYIQRHLFRNITKSKYNNDYKALNDLFYDCFLPLCSKYNRTVTIQNFCLFTGIDKSNIYDITDGTYRDGSKINPETYSIVKKWMDTAETALVDSGMQGNPVFPIFVLKARHGWREAPTEIAITGSTTQSTPEQIAERFRDAKKPELPNFQTISDTEKEN